MTNRGGLTLWTLWQCTGPTLTVQANLKRAQEVAEIAGARGPRGSKSAPEDKSPRTMINFPKNILQSLLQSISLSHLFVI